MKTLCLLKDVTYLGGNIPDYSSIAVQQLYLLKYFPAYLIEYYDIYRDVLTDKFIKLPLNILSLLRNTSQKLFKTGPVFPGQMA